MPKQKKGKFAVITACKGASEPIVNITDDEKFAETLQKEGASAKGCISKIMRL